jgi:hypothetical protein
MYKNKLTAYIFFRSIFEPTLKQIISSEFLVLVTGKVRFYRSLTRESQGLKLQRVHWSAFC